MDVQSLLLISGALVVIAVCVFMLFELRARTLRTRVVDVQGTLRFEAHTFSIEVKQTAKQILVHVNAGHLTRRPLLGGSDEVQQGPLDVTLPAPGLTIAVKPPETTPREGQDRPRATGLYSITVRASDGLINAAQNLPGGYETTLEISNIPEPVAKSLGNFSNRLQIWADKMEHRLKAELAQKEEDSARIEKEATLLAQSAAAAGPQNGQELANDQVARWRKVAGFRGAHSEVSIAANGKVHWFIDLAEDGRVTIHTNNRTIHTSLLGASFLPDKLDLQILVRDDYWTEEDRVMTGFRLFDGLPPDDRRVWKDRLETARNKLDKAANLGEGHQR
ncbi:hypothetical protein [Rhodoferax sp. PAMC 29310]|uniref:hypothetical protein n=1 Tax=Rhodoferax sp. PAMC 29310 TaxID=2822760 RepID=UPI001B321323|nr:hypothetical protein [Rhodoferax sp. PAMC 29310]